MKNPLFNPTFHMKKLPIVKQKVDTIRIKSQQMKTEHLFQKNYPREFRPFGNGGINKEIQTTNFP